MDNDETNDGKQFDTGLATNLALLGNYVLRKPGNKIEPDSIGPIASTREEAERLWKDQLAKQEVLVERRRKLYLIGSLRNEFVPALADRLRLTCPDTEIFDDWYSAGPEADDYWKKYEQGRGRTYSEALKGYAAKHVFEFDKHHLDTCTHAVLVLPAGKSGHMEVTYAKYGAGAKAAILLEQGADIRFDCMYQFVDAVLENEDELVEWLNA